MRHLIDSLPAGAQLPPTRALTGEYGVGPATVQQAVRRLVTMGLVESRPGAGNFVRSRRIPRSVDFSWQTSVLAAVEHRPTGVSATQRVAGPEEIAMHSAYPMPELLPQSLLRAAFGRAARSAAATALTPTAGLPELQEWFAAEQAAGAAAGSTANTAPSARDVLIVAGSQGGLRAVFRSVVGTGGPLVIESPSYWGAITLAAHEGIRLVPVSTGPQGPDPEAVARALDATGARAFYAQPTFSNPLGGQWSPERAEAILDIVRRRGAFLIEDDWAFDLGIDADPRPLAGLDDAGHVIRLRSLTKSVSPALRVAAVIARGPVRERLFTDRAVETMYVSGLLQAAAVDVVTRPGWRVHLKELRRQLRARRDLLLDALRHYAPEVRVESPPVGGLHLWARLPEGAEARALVRDAAAQGVLVAAGDEWFPAEPSGPHLRLNFTGTAPDRFPQAASVLGEVLRAQR